MNSRLVLLKRSQIDEMKWNHAVNSSPGANLYGLVHTLDLLAGNWDAMICDDYRYVMPLPFRKKFGIRYVYTPLFIQRLDVFGVNCSVEIRFLFIEALKSCFKYFDIDVAFEFNGPGLLSTERTNLLLALQPDYGAIASSYHDEAKRSIRKAVARHCVFTKDIMPAEVVELYRRIYGKKVSGHKNDYRNMLAFAESAAADGNLTCCGVRHSTSGELFFGALFFRSGNRIYYLLGAPTEQGRSARAGYFLIDAIIRQYAGTKYLLDFEGSDIPGVASFYRKFNPLVEHYYHLHYNNLPWLMRLFKK